MKTTRTRVAAVLAAALLAWAPGAATAENVVMHIWATDGSTTANDWITIPMDDRGYFDAEGTSETNLWTLDWDLSGDADPIVNSNFFVVNNQATTQEFNVTVNVPISPAFPFPTKTSGSLGLTVTDANGDGVTLSNRANLDAIYTALVDTLDDETLFDFPYSLSAGAFASNNDFDDFGLPGITDPGPPALSSIGIQIQFALTGRDAAGVTSTFTLVPEPASIALGVFALAATIGLARRRR